MILSGILETSDKIFFSSPFSLLFNQIDVIATPKSITIWNSNVKDDSTIHRIINRSDKFENKCWIGWN